MKYIMSLIILSVIISVPVQSRNSERVKHIGLEAGFDIKAGYPDISTGGGVVKTLEGCAKISDADGRLLFYTDGVNIYNREHRQMPNGYELTGNKSANQAGVVVPQPGAESRYYIFTANKDKMIGVRFTIVDMDADNGLGDVTMKNVALRVPAAEKVTSQQHSNGVDYWIITHDWNSSDFYVYLLTENGIDGPPVISNTGIALQGAEENKLGFFKFSPDSRKLASSIYGKGIIEIFRFDFNTGEVSAPIAFESDLYNTNFDVEFSPNSSVVYVTELNSPAKIVQYNIGLGSADSVRNSATVIYQSKNKARFGSLYPGEDGRIYLTNYSNKFLGIIEEPDKPGKECRFVEYNQLLDYESPRPGNAPRFMEKYIPTDVAPQSYREDVDLDISADGAFDEVTISLKTADAGEHLVEILSMDGKVMESVGWTDNRENKSVILNFNTSAYPTGLYFLILKTGRQRVSRSLAIWR